MCISFRERDEVNARRRTSMMNNDVHSDADTRPAHAANTSREGDNMEAESFDMLP